MRIVVDEMPKTSSECIFNEPRTTSKDHPYCCLNTDYSNVCTDPKNCPYLVESERVVALPAIIY